MKKAFEKAGGGDVEKRGAAGETGGGGSIDDSKFSHSSWRRKGRQREGGGCHRAGNGRGPGGWGIEGLG